MDDSLRKLEAFLFVASEGITLSELVERTGMRESDVLKMVELLQQEYLNRGSAIKINKYPNGLFRMTVDRGIIDNVSDLAPGEFNKSLVKTLAVIAWKKGIKQSDVIRIRGNKSYEQIEQLEQLGFITAEPYGNTKKLFLTNNFYKYFNINQGEEKFLFKEEM